jgi:outer membrane protein, multidrug efflux system
VRKPALNLPWVTSATLAMALSACTVGPNYRIPDRAVVNSPDANGAFVAHPDQRALTTTPLPLNWWRLYDDHRLDQLVQQALAANTDLRMANANLERSQALLREAKTARQPGLAIQGGMQHGQLSGEQFLQRVTPPVNTYYDVEATLAYDLDLFGAIRRGIEAASAEDEAVEAARDLVRVNVAAETARAYANACGAGLQLAAARKSLDLQHQSLAITQRLLAGGRAIDLDVMRSRQQVDQLASIIPSLEASRRNAVYRLTTLTGKPPSQFDTEIDQCAIPPRLMQPLPVGDGAALLKRRPDIREAERQLAAATADIGVATAQLYPTIRLGLSAGSLGARPDAFSSPTNFWTIGGLVAWQANQSVARARVAEARASAKLTLAHFDGVVLSSLQEAESALNVYVHDLEREGSLRAARDEAASAAELARRLQIGGRENALDVLDAERTLASAEQSFAQLEAAISNDQISVFLALGGGWEMGEGSERTSRP